MSDSDPFQKMSLDTLRNLLNIHGEANNLDFKQTFSLSSQKERAELVRDILALANTEGGGHIVFGVVDKTFEPVGLPANVPHIDTTTIYNAISKYISANIQLMAAEYEIEWPTGSEKKRFGILYVAKYPSIVVPRCDVAYEEDKGEKKKTITLIQQNDILVRSGAQSLRANQAVLDRLIGLSYTNNSNIQTHRLDGNLPAREEVAFDFVGRGQELTELWIWFKDPYRKRWMLTGDGGKGKTAIAYEFATQVMINVSEEFVCILWMSAKRRRFEEGVIQSIDVPDFWDLPSLLDAIVKGYGFAEYLDLPPYQKRERAIELITKLPALIIADDIDSLEAEDENAIDFLASDLAVTPSKVLLTSRRVPFGLGAAKTQISGLNQQDGEKFIRSRVRLFGLDSRIFIQRIINEIMETTEGSPLYLEDLLRLCSVLSPEVAITEWKNRKGDEARQYALQREFDELTPSARKIVVACCIPGVPVSLTEIQAITGLSQDQVMSEMQAIQNLFLISRPRLIDGEHRFDVNANTRRLILHIFEKKDLLSRLQERYKGLLGQQGVQGKGDIASYIRKAVSLQHLGKHEEAEHLLLKTLDRYPNNPDLTAQLGEVYSRWQPRRRRADAREQFKRAAQLKCSHESMYRVWANMESEDKEWNAAIEAAETGIKLTSTPSKELYFLEPPSGQGPADGRKRLPHQR